MHGNPLFRVLVLALVLAVAGVIVFAVVRTPESGVLGVESGAASPEEDGSLPLLFILQLSAPAASVSCTSLDGQGRYLAPHRPADLSTEFRALVPVLDNAVTILLNIDWEVPSESRFVRIVVEPDYLESREHVLHMPDHVKNHAITFEWPSPEIVDP